MSDQTKVVVRSDSGTIGGTLWFMGWLFTVGYLKLALWKGIASLVVWPYFLGAAFHR